MLAGEVVGRSMEHNGAVYAGANGGALHHSTDVVGDEEHGHSVLLVECGDELMEPIAPDRVHARYRLV